MQGRDSYRLDPATSIQEQKNKGHFSNSFSPEIGW